MTFKELGDDALLKINALVTFNNLTTPDTVLKISEALHEMQKETKVMEKTITINASDLDANGAIALDRSITLPRRGTFTPPGTTISGPCNVKTISRDVMARIKQNYAFNRGRPNQIYLCIEQNALNFFPFQGLNGTFTLSCVAKMPIYVLSDATDTTSFWYGWDAAHIDALYKSTLIPQEFEDALTGLTCYVAAELLTLISGWKRRFAEDYVEFKRKFESEMENIKENLPDYDLNYEPVMNYGW